jgi:GYF domain 2
MNFYLVVNGIRKGPLALQELAAHGLERDSLVWHAGLGDWTRADKVVALQELLATIPPPLPSFLDVHAAGPKYEETPSTLQRLYRWWVICFTLTLALPLLGVLCMVIALAEYHAVRTSSGRYYYTYSDVGILLNVIGGLSVSLGALSFIAAIAFFAVLLYKMWKVIQDGHARTTPDKAVGFLFIPFFNLYWAFVAIRGLAVDLDSYVRRHRAGMDTERAPTTLALVSCIMLACSAVPYVGLLFIVPMGVVLSLVLTRMKNTVLLILRVRQATEEDRVSERADTSREQAIESTDPAAHFRPAGLRDAADSI